MSFCKCMTDQMKSMIWFNPFTSNRDKSAHIMIDKIHHYGVIHTVEKEERVNHVARRIALA